MKLTRIIFTFLFFVGVATQVLAQNYTVNTKTQRINDTKYDGYTIHIKGPLEQVTEQMYTYLKTKSKVRRKRSYYSIAEFNMKKMKLDSTVIYLKLNSKDNNTVVWLGIKTFGLDKNRLEAIEDALKKELVIMARGYYVHQQELKIQEAELAATVVSKKQQTLIDQRASLSVKLTETEARKVELEKWLVENDLLIKSLNQQLIDNQFTQDSTYLDLQKINKVIEVQKQKLKEID